MGLPEFLTKYNHDPSNIQFLSNRLNTSKFSVDRKVKRQFSFLVWLQERQSELRPTLREVLPDMYRPLTAKSNWESRLILPKLVFPNKYAAYTVKEFLHSISILFSIVSFSDFEIQLELFKVPIGNVSKIIWNNNRKFYQRKMSMLFNHFHEKTD